LIEGLKLSNFKIGGPILQNDENRGTKIVFKSKKIDILNLLYYFFVTDLKKEGFLIFYSKLDW